MNTSLTIAPTRRAHRAGSERPLAGGNASAVGPTWERPAFFALLVGTAVLYLWGLGESAWTNAFYSAAVQAGSESWKAFFFGSLDSADAITVDKPPLALWPMALSVRLFGLSSWSILVPEALFGVASVALLATTVRRASGSAVTGLLAGAALALTPVAVLMFRFNNPDALLTLLLIGSAAATLRAIEATRRSPRTGTLAGHPLRWLALAGALVGLAFLTKMLQAFLVLPALVLAYAIFASVPLWRRLGHLLVAFVSMVVAGGWWIAIVEVWPADSRPYIGGSQSNSILELTLGYNGLGRLTGNETGSVVPGGAQAGGQGGGMWGETGIGRLFDSSNGGQIAWLIPAALVLGLAGLWFGRRDRRLTAALVVWLGWMVTTAVTFSFMAGIFHAYYSIALAPAVAAAAALGGQALWRHRLGLGARLVLAAGAAVTTGTAFVLLRRSTDFLPWLPWLVLVAGATAAAGLLISRLATAAAVLAVVAALAGPASYAVQTAATAHTGSIPTAGPQVAGNGPGGLPGAMTGGMPGGGPGAMPGGMPPGGGPGGMPGAQGDGAGGGPGGLLSATEPSSEITDLLTADAHSYTWIAAAVGAQNAAGYQLATELPVMSVGGFNGSDPSPTLVEFKAMVAAGEIHYFIGGGMGGMGGPGGQMGGSNSSAEITSWVAEAFTAQTVDGVTLYDLSVGVS